MEIDYTAIGRRIKAARKRGKITQEVLAERAGISTPHMSNIETGKTKLGLPTIIAICNILDVSVDELLCDSVIHSKTIFEAEAQRLFEDCSPYETRILVDTLSAVKESLRTNRKFLLDN